MPQQCQLIGIIEMDTDRRLHIRRDETLGAILRSLRSECGLPADELFADDIVLDSCEAYGAVESIHVRHANLPQLRSDLEHELRRLIQRLLAVM
jgi:hypothetical protein